MAAEVVSLQSAEPAVLPDPAFVETSFLRDAIQWGRTRRGGPRAQAAMEFIRQLHLAGADVWTTPEVIQEVLYGFLREAIRSAAPDDAGGRPVEWAAFKRHQPAAFAEAFRSHAPMIATGLRRFLRTEGITIRLPRTSGREARGGVVLYGMMRMLLQRHVIEPADALHCAAAWVDGTSAMLTNDAAFQEIDGSIIYTSL